MCFTEASEGLLTGALQSAVVSDDQLFRVPLSVLAMQRCHSATVWKRIPGFALCRQVRLIDCEIGTDGRDLGLFTASQLAVLARELVFTLALVRCHASSAILTARASTGSCKICSSISYICNGVALFCSVNQDYFDRLFLNP